MNQVFTFWEGEMPGYIKLCMDTWKFPYTVLNYSNLHNYTDLVVDSNLTRFTFPQIADCVRVHTLRDQGGYWLDADTIACSDRLPDVSILGNNSDRSNTIGFLKAEVHSDMYTKWAAFQDQIISQASPSYHWNVVGNAFTDPYLREHPEIYIGDIQEHWAETYMVCDNISRWDKYQKFYFMDNYKLSDIKPIDLLMLHNSWTPKWYKKLSISEVLSYPCTLSNILKELLI